MKPMRPLLAFLAVMACAGCATGRDAAVATARREVLRRGLPLPAAVQVTVEDSMAFIEAGPTYPLYLVTFSVYSSRGKKILYEVSINRQSGKAEDFDDFSKHLH
jgi:hypothetical protein